MAKRVQEFQTIHSEGGLLPPDLLRRVIDPKAKLPGTTSSDYGLPEGDRLNEIITQSWIRLLKHWAEFRKAAEDLGELEAGTGLTNDKWNIPLLRELGFGILPTSPGPEINGRTYAINRFFGPTPIHLIGCKVDLDRRAAGVRGAASVNPHGLVQEFLNRSDDHLWAIVCNGYRLRILRDSQALSRQCYLEFDLQSMLEGEVFSDFVLLWLLGHATRFNPRDDGRPESCWLEEWTKIAEEQGTRALTDLRGGVEKALQILGQGFVGHPRNTALREALRTGKLQPSDLHGQLLRLVYRFIFLFVAEDRSIEGVSLIHPRDESENARMARDHYNEHYSTSRLREMASKIKGSRHGDLWQQFNLTVGALSGNERFEMAREKLALPTLGSFLWDPEKTSALNASSVTGNEGSELANSDLLEAIRHLAYTRQGKILRPVDYKNLGAEELGGVYESLLALTPQVSSDGAHFTFAEFAGSERKTSGSYYTPDSLVQCLLDSALDPVVEQAISGKTGKEAEKAILSLKICDPAVGSGHFLVGAAHRLARHLARVRAHAEGESEPSPLLYQHALRDIIGSCLYGVDINPMAAELCRVSLWLEALEPGKPLTFLEHRIKCGNSLLGTSPALLKKGIPDEAFKPIEGDDKKICAQYRKENKRAKSAVEDLFGKPDKTGIMLGNLPSVIHQIDSISDDSPQGIEEKQKKYEEFTHSSGYLNARFWADSWCAAFVWNKTKEFSYPITEEEFRKIERNPHDVPVWMRDEIIRLSQLYQFFHWHIEFPDVFGVANPDEIHDSTATGWTGGFDCVLGNPPWEKVQPEERQFFISLRPDIALATGAERKRIISQLKSEDKLLWSQWNAYRNEFERFSHFIRSSGGFTLSAVGNLNTSTLFLDLSASVARYAGRVGLIIPSGIASNDITSDFFQSFIRSERIRSLYDFENSQGMFPDVHRSFRFCLIVIGAASHPDETADFSFYRKSISELSNPTNHFTLTQRDFDLLSPNTGTCPTFTNVADAELTKAVYRRVPVFVKESPEEVNPWQTRIYAEMYNMTRASHLFHTTEDLLGRGGQIDGFTMTVDSTMFMPVYEARMLGIYDHRSCSIGVNPRNVFRGAVSETTSIEEHRSADHFAAPRYWLDKADFHNAILVGYEKQWFAGFRMVTAATNERTMIGSVFPRTPFVNTISGLFNDLSAIENTMLMANLSSFVLDYIARQRISGVSLNFFVAKQLPIAPPDSYQNKEFIVPRVLELFYTAWDLEAFGKDCGWCGPPFFWDEERRFILRCELDAAYFHLYLPAGDDGGWQPADREIAEDMESLKACFSLPRHAVEYIMDSFSIVKRRDEAEHGRYRTKDTILEIYDEMSEANRAGKPYQTRLDPPPGPPLNPDGTFAMLPDWPAGAPKPTNWPVHIHEPKRD